MTKIVNWERALDQYIDSVRNVGFDWGNLDCLSFANNCVKAQIGSGFCDDWVEGFTSLRGAAIKVGRLAQLDEYSSCNGQFELAVDMRLPRLKTRLPPRGSVVGMVTPPSQSATAGTRAIHIRAATSG